MGIKINSKTPNGYKVNSKPVNGYATKGKTIYTAYQPSWKTRWSGLIETIAQGGYGERTLYRTSYGNFNTANPIRLSGWVYTDSASGNKNFNAIEISTTETILADIEETNPFFYVTGAANKGSNFIHVICYKGGNTGWGYLGITKIEEYY